MKAREVRVSDKVNPFRDFVEVLGKNYEEKILPHPYGATAIRTWPCGCALIRRVRLNFETGVYEMFDEPRPCPRHEKIFNARGGSDVA